MTATLLIGFIFCLSFFIESIIGFGGTLIAFAILGFFADIKELIITTIYIASCASIYVLFSNSAAFSGEIFRKYFPLCVAGNIVGVWLFTHLNSEIILKLFAILLIFLAVKSLFFPHFKLRLKIDKPITFLSGISHGVFGSGGPILVIALREKFKDKTFLRATMAVFFLSLNIVRAIQLEIQNKLDFTLLLKFWWLALPLIPAIHWGHKIHKMIDEKNFKIIILSFILFSGVQFLLR